MRWETIDARYPETPLPLGPGAMAVQARVPVLASHLARAALGLATTPIARDTILGTIADALRYGVAVEPGRQPMWRGVMALMAALERDWDLVARCTGGAMLGSRVVAHSTFRDNIPKLARHLATVARARLPATDVAPAMAEVREQFLHDRMFPDARAAVLAAQLFVRDIVVAQDAIATTRAWLAGESLELDATRIAQAVADGEDPRVKIFERFAGELADDAALDAELGKLESANLEDWNRALARERIPYDNHVIRAFVARRPLVARWDHCIDPMVAAWLGANPTAETEQRFRDVAMVVGKSLKLDRGWDDAVKALAVGQPTAVVELTGFGKLTPFRPGQFFKDDGRKLLRYFAAALLEGAHARDVMPAWVDFLARRSPATTPRIERGELQWRHLLALQSVITHQLAGAPRGDTGRALQELVTGV